METNVEYGLTEEEVKKSRQKNGTNTINSREETSFMKKFLESLGDPIIRILLIALGIKLVFLIKDFDWYETVGIVVAIFIIYINNIRIRK
jgi:magnesium-transporting ATPase (P-type)